VGNNMTTREELTARIDPFWSERPVWRGLSVGDGWLDLIDQLINDLEAAGEMPEIVQIKEKFGGLRFYVQGANEDQHNLINEAENTSLETCEECGKSGASQTVEGWIQTLCESCNGMAEERRIQRSRIQRRRELVEKMASNADEERLAEYEDESA
jgi:hypothetical protein